MCHVAYKSKLFHENKKTTIPPLHFHVFNIKIWGLKNKITFLLKKKKNNLKNKPVAE